MITTTAMVIIFLIISGYVIKLHQEKKPKLTSIDEISGIDDHTKTALKKAGFHYAQELADYRPADLVSINRIGEKRARTLYLALKGNNVRVK